MTKAAREIARTFAKKLGYDTVKRSGFWRSYEVFDYFNEGEPVGAVGLPDFIFVKDGKARLSSTEEAFAFISTLPD